MNRFSKLMCQIEGDRYVDLLNFLSFTSDSHHRAGEALNYFIFRTADFSVLLLLFLTNQTFQTSNQLFTLTETSDEVQMVWEGVGLNKLI